MVMELVPTLSSQRHYGANSLEHRRARESNPFRIVVLPKEQRECTRLFSQEFGKNNIEEETDKLRSSYQIGLRITSKDECSEWRHSLYKTDERFAKSTMNSDSVVF